MNKIGLLLIFPIGTQGKVLNAHNLAAAYLQPLAVAECLGEVQIIPNFDQALQKYHESD
jgi:hypothetical protein